MIRRRQPETVQAMADALNETHFNALADSASATYSPGRRAAARNLVAQGLLRGSAPVGYERTMLGNRVYARARKGKHAPGRTVVDARKQSQMLNAALRRDR